MAANAGARESSRDEAVESVGQREEGSHSVEVLGDYFGLSAGVEGCENGALVIIALFEHFVGHEANARGLEYDLGGIVVEEGGMVVDGVFDIFKQQSAVGFRPLGIEHLYRLSTDVGGVAQDGAHPSLTDIYDEPPLACVGKVGGTQKRMWIAFLHR